MYNLKVEAERLMKILLKEGYESRFIGPYPYLKYHNATHNDKIRTKDVQFVTSAPLEVLQKHFNVIKVSNDYVKNCIIQTELKQNLTDFKVYYSNDYVSKVDGKVTKIKNFNDVLKNVNFLLEMVTIDLSGKMHCIENCDPNGYTAIKSSLLIPNGDFEKLIKKNPLAILESCVYSSNVPYVLPEGSEEIIKNNYEYLKYENIEDIIDKVNQIILSNNPLIGLNIIKRTMIDYEYNGKKIFNFVNYLDNKEDIIKLNNDDFISRWAFILNSMPQDIIEDTIDIFNLDKGKLLWLIQNFNLPKSENLKEDIYELSKTISSINKSRRHNVFMLYHLLNTLSKIYKILDPENEKKYTFMVDLVCARPFYNDQVLYEDSDIEKIIGKSLGDKLEDYKTLLVKTVLMMDNHPSDDGYLEVMRDLAKNF